VSAKTAPEGLHRGRKATNHPTRNPEKRPKAANRYDYDDDCDCDYDPPCIFFCVPWTFSDFPRKI